MSSPAARQQLWSCDTLVARSQGEESRAIFGKNSDRPVVEAQPLEHVPRMNHAAASYLRCQYLSIPQARHTLAVLGSRPWWLWGFEHGLNEAGVAIGNEAIYTRDKPGSKGLLGMDLVRLGLERGSSAREALEVITGLLEEHGQGGDAINVGYFTAQYHNSFIIADAEETYVLETSGRHWVYRRTTESVAIANLLTIEDDWDGASKGIDEHARERGWWGGPRDQKLNFRLAFEDRALRTNTQDRFASSCRFLEEGESAATVSGMKRHLRDHFEGGTVHIPETPDRPRPLSICAHPGHRAGATAASMVVDLVATQRSPTAWCSMSTPCTGVFIPVPVQTVLPTALSVGGSAEDNHSLWWAMRGLSEIAEHDPARLTPPIQEAWSSWESDLLAATEAEPDSAARELEGRVNELLERRALLVESIGEAALAASHPVN